MNEEILNNDIQCFILKNLNKDIHSILFKKSTFDNVSLKEIAQQILSKKKCKKKLPAWFKTPQIYYPKTLNIEQTSSEVTAQYKQEIISGNSIIDLSGGLGVDSYFFSKKIKEVFHCEIDEELAKIAAHNFQVLGVKNIKQINTDGLAYLNFSTIKYDWLYIDPSRRNNLKGKVFQLSDCLPNVVAHQNIFFQKANNILIKTAPFLDITSGIKDLSHIKEIHIVAVNGEVKELLWILQKNHQGEIAIKTINIKKDTREVFHFLLKEEKENTSVYSEPLKYLYEPNAAIMKSGAFKTIGDKYGLLKIHQHTHLYTSNELIEFPGRIFVIKKSLPFDKKTKTALKGIKTNISLRNFPIKITELKKKYKIKDGGHQYLFFTTDLNHKLMVLHCEKME